MATLLSTTTSTEADGGASTDSTVYQTTTDLSILQTRDAYIDANLTTILHTTPKQHTYLDTTPNTAHSMTDAQLIDRQRLRIEALERENATWVEQYHLATEQIQSRQVYVDQLQHQLDQQQPQPTQPSDSRQALAGLLHARNSLYQTMLSENAALLSRLDSLQRRCRVQEGMIDTRNAAIREMQRICTQQQQRQAGRRKAQQVEAQSVAADKQPVVHEEEKREEDEVDTTAAAAPLNYSLQHSRQSSTASERSVELEQAEALIDAVLTRPPRIFVPTSTSSSVASTTPSSPKEERKQLDDSNSSPPRVVQSKPSTLSRRIGKPPLTVKLQRPVVSAASTRLSPRSAASPSPASSSSSASVAGAATRTRSSSAVSAATGAASRTGLRAGSGVGKSPTLSPSLSPVPSSPRSPLNLSTAARPPRTPHLARTA